MQRQSKSDCDVSEIKILVPYYALGAVYGKECVTIDRFRDNGCDVHVNRDMTVEFAPSECVCFVKGDSRTVLDVSKEIFDKINAKLTREINKGSDPSDMIRRDEAKLLVSEIDISKIIGSTGKSVEEIIGNGASISVFPEPGSYASKTSDQYIITIKYNVEMNMVCMEALNKIISAIGPQEMSQTNCEDGITSEAYSDGYYEDSSEECEESSDDCTEDSLYDGESNSEELLETTRKLSLHSYTVTPKKTPTRRRRDFLAPKSIRDDEVISNQNNIEPTNPRPTLSNQLSNSRTNDKQYTPELDFTIFEELTMKAVFGC